MTPSDRSLDERLERLGEAISARQDTEILSKIDLSRARQQALATPSPRALAGRVWLLAAAAMLLVVAGGALSRALLRAPSSPPLALDSPAASVGSLVQARDEALPLRFSDGSSVELAPKTSSRIAALDAQGARVVVERGRASVHVAKRSGARWRFLAGPLVVDVTGTRFELAWSPEDEQATLTMREGSVDISGCGVVGKRSVRAPEALRLDSKQGQPPQPVAATTIVPSPKTTKGATVNEPPPARAAEPAWQSLARAGRYSEARALVEARGFQEQLRTAEAGDLLLLGDVSRYTGRAAEAAQVYQQVRQRFPNTDSSALAAFALGRLAFDQKGAYAEAASLFQTYVRERPRGSFALEARGRRMEALHRAGDTTGARAAASEYLRLYPNGLHAAQARQLLGAP
jgi:hypothetical protein